jgi:hypothetical protein
MNSSALSHTPRSNETCDRDETAAREHRVKETLRCPHCDGRLSKWAVPDSPFNEWPSEFQYVCFHDECPYFVKGWAWMREKFQVTASYRHRLDPSNGESGPLPVWSNDALKAGIIKDSNSENSQKDIDSNE